MKPKDLKQIDCTFLEELFTEEYGEIGTPQRTEFELSCDTFILGERLKNKHQQKGMMQEELASKTRRKENKSYL